jgi:molybdate transport system permease protein
MPGGKPASYNTGAIRGHELSELIFSRPRNEASKPVRRWMYDRVWLLSLPMLAFLALPLLALLLRIPPMSLLDTLGEPGVHQAIGISLQTSLITVALTVIFGSPLAYLLARRSFRFKRLVEALVDLPIVLPPAVAGVALLIAFGRHGILGETLDLWGIQIAFTPLAVVLAQIFIAAPLFIRSAAIGFASVEPELEQAAGLDGASSWAVFRLVTLPLSRYALLSGVMMTWARALGEFGATIIFAGNFPGRTQTMPLAIYLGFELDMAVALTLSVIMLGLSFTTLFLVKIFFQHERD